MIKTTDIDKEYAENIKNIQNQRRIKMNDKSFTETVECVHNATFSLIKYIEEFVEISEPYLQKHFSPELIDALNSLCRLHAKFNILSLGIAARLENDLLNILKKEDKK